MHTSLRHDLTIKLSLVILAVGLTIGLIYYRMTVSQTERDFLDFTSAKADNLSEILATHLWTFDKTSINNICISAIGAREVVGLKLTDENGATLFMDGRFHAGDVLTYQKPIFFKGQQLGQLDMAFTNLFLAEKKRSIIHITLYSIFFITIATVFLLQFMLRRNLFLPLENLRHHLDRLADGEYALIADREQKSELVGIMETFNALTKKLSEKTISLTRSENRFRTLVNQATDAIYVADEQGNLIDVNRQAEKNLGYSREELLRLTVADVDPLFIAKAHPESVWRNLTTDRTIFLESLHRRKDGSIFPVEINTTKIEIDGQPAILGIARDISDRKKGEQTLQALYDSMVGLVGQEFFENAVRRMCALLDCDCAVIGVLTDHGRVNAVAMMLDGEIVTDYSYELAGAPCQNVIQKGFSHYPEDVCALFPHDLDLVKLQAVGYVGTPVRDKNGNAIGVFCAISRKKLVLQPDTEKTVAILASKIAAEIDREHVEEEQKKLKEDLYQALKMEAIGTLAGGIAHDFNNILSAILGYADMARDEVYGNMKASEYLDQVVGGAYRARDLVQQILTFSRKGSRKAQPLAPYFIIKESMKLLRASLPATIAIQESLDPECGKILADPTKIQQTVVNLCTNALHAMEDQGGTLRITLTRKEIRSGEAEELGNMTPGPYIELLVSDTGYGMNKAVMQKIFDPYFTTKEVGKGTGMGLAVVHGIVAECGGRISVESEVGRGSTFHVYFPAISEPAQEVRPEEKPGPLPYGTERVLFVDDEETITALQKIVLERFGYAVTATTSSSEALQMFAADPAYFDLVITDQTMPDMTGIDLTRKILAARPDIPVILCTGYSAGTNEEQAKKLGIKAFLLKPVSTEMLVRQVRQMLDAAGKRS